MGRFENENQMREAPMESAKAQPGRATHTNYLKKGAGAQNVLQRRKEFRARRGGELRGLLGREVLGGQQLMMTQPQQQQQQFGARPGMGFGSQQAQQQPAMMGAGTRGIESRLLSKPPLRHWGYEPSIVYQPDIDQAPNFKRRVAVRRERGARIHRVRRGVAWDIPVYDRERHEKGGLAWTIPMDKDFYEGDVKPRKTKKSKSKSLLSRFTSGVKRAFTGHHAASKQPKVAVRPQQRLAARKRGEAYTARSGLPPQAPVVEKRRLRKVEHTTDADVRKQEAFARAPGATAAAGVSSSSGVAEDRGVLVNGRRIHTTHLSEQPLMRQAPPMSEDKSAAKKLNSGRTSTTAPSGHHAAPAGHTKGHGMAAQQERRQQHVRTG